LLAADAPNKRKKGGQRQARDEQTQTEVYLFGDQYVTILDKKIQNLEFLWVFCNHFSKTKISCYNLLKIFEIK